MTKQQLIAAVKEADDIHAAQTDEIMRLNDVIRDLKRVEITLEGGVIQDILVPKGVQVVVYDYDTDGVDPAELETDAAGDDRIVTTWECT